MLPPRSPRAQANISSLSFEPRPRLTVSLFLHRGPFSSVSNSPLSLFLHRIAVVLPSSLQLGPSVSLWPSLPLAHKARCDAVPLSWVEVWQHRGSGCASRALSPRGGDCGKILMPPTTPFAAVAADDDDDDGAQPAATGAGNKFARLPAFTLQESLKGLREKRIIRTSRGNPPTTISQCSPKLNLSSFHCVLQIEELFAIRK